MNPYLTKEEILRKFYELREVTGSSYHEWYLVFAEGGREITVFEYGCRSEAEALWEDDALMHWMKVLKRTWDDEDFKEAPDAA
jgi:hypothetical protein